VQPACRDCTVGTKLNVLWAVREEVIVNKKAMRVQKHLGSLKSVHVLKPRITPPKD